MHAKVKIIALEGPDGAGKTTYIKEHLSHRDLTYIHAAPFSRRWSDVRDKFKRNIIEVFMDTECVINSWKAKIMGERGIVMDRTFLSGQVYSEFWSREYDNWIPYKIALFIHRFAYKPKYLLVFFPDLGKAKPRKNYSQDEIQHLASLYRTALIRNGYKIISEEPYGLGTVAFAERV